MADSTSDPSVTDATNPGTSDPTNLGTTDASNGNLVTNPSDNPSNQIDFNSLFSNLLGASASSYAANQQSNAQIAAAQALAANAGSSNPLLFLSTTQGKTYLYVGIGILALALILRK